MRSSRCSSNEKLSSDPSLVLLLVVLAAGCPTDDQQLLVAADAVLAVVPVGGATDLAVHGVRRSRRSRRSPGRSCGRGGRRRPSSPAADRGGTWDRRTPPASTRRMSRQTSRPIRSASASGPIGWFIPSFITSSIASALPDPLVEAEDRLVDHRHQHPVGDEARRVVHLHRRLAHRRATPRRRRRRSSWLGGQAADDLDQLHQRHRVHEVHADHLVRAARWPAASLVIEIELVLVARIVCRRADPVELARAPSA